MSTDVVSSRCLDCSRRVQNGDLCQVCQEQKLYSSQRQKRYSPMDPAGHPVRRNSIARRQVVQLIEDS